MTRHVLAVIGLAAFLFAGFAGRCQWESVTAAALFTTVGAATWWGYLWFDDARKPVRYEYRADVWARRDGPPIDDLPYARVDRGQA